MLPDLSFFDQLADAASAETLSRFRKNVSVENKYETGFDPVTEADKAAERAIRELIEGKYPDHGILGEEEDSKNLDSEFVWVIDPIDGTRAYITGLPVWGTLIGLYQNGRAIMGMMDQPFTGERFVADQNNSYLKFRGGEAEKITTSECLDLSSARIFTTAPELMVGEAGKKFDALKDEVKLTRYGCDCYAFAMVAMGMADITLEVGVQPYDVGGLISVVENAGGVISTWGGDRPEMGGNIIASANTELHAKALEILNA